MVENAGKQIGHSCLSHELDHSTLAWTRRVGRPLLWAATRTGCDFNVQPDWVPITNYKKGKEDQRAKVVALNTSSQLLN